MSGHPFFAKTLRVSKNFRGPSFQAAGREINAVLPVRPWTGGSAFLGIPGMGALKRIAIWTAIGATLIGLAFISGIAPAP